MILKKEIVLDIVFWLLAVLWCCVIFSFSTENGEESGGTSEKVCRFVAGVFVSDFEEMDNGEQEEIVERMQFFIRKTAHFTAYGILGFLIALALRRKKPLIRGALSVALSCLYAISDEIHQSFVPQRNGSVFDVLLDTSGALAGFFAAWLICVIIVRAKEKRLENNG